jgi:hypothetical protein
MKIISGIASTTHIDRDGDRMAKSALLSMAEQINDHYIPLTAFHKPIYIGVILCGKVKELEDGEWALHTVSGVFETPGERNKYTYGEPNMVSQKYLHLLDDSVTKE